MDIQERLAHTLLKLARTHGRSVASEENMVKLRLRLSHDFLAGMIGSNRPYLSNIMSSFKKKGWIAYGNHHLLVDVAALEGLVGS
jgi:CRP-like cAMP-binding protein